MIWTGVSNAPTLSVKTIDMAADMGFKRMLLTGHIGKLIKVAGGIMNTHSREADCRIELLTAFAFKCGVAPEYIKRIMDSLTTEEALAALKESGRLYEVWIMRWSAYAFIWIRGQRADLR